ncbi:AaceriADL019Wp [[Ashbya] aceris (nom. inval.)]|nr:AaceriADL019Wp [[Ashbya] aceris (nom. inval.)]
MNILAESPGGEELAGVPAEEEEILNYFSEVRNLLSRLKQDRNQYLNSRDVMATYQAVLTKVRLLDQVRKHRHGADDTAGGVTLIHSAALHNRVDSVLDDVFQLLSLSFLTVGLKNTAPATYASLSTVQRLLEHMEEANVYTYSDLRPIKERLDEVAEIVEKNSYMSMVEDEAPLDELAEEKRLNKLEEDLLVRAKLQHCLDRYQKVESKLEAIPPDLQPLSDKLFHIRRELLSLAASAKTDRAAGESSSDRGTAVTSSNTLTSRLKELEGMITEVESHRDDSGRFISPDDPDILPEKGQSALNGLLDDCRNLLGDLSHQTSGVLHLDPQLQPIYEELLEIKTTLENLLVTRRWTLRETDLFAYQKRLAELDSLRVNRKFPSNSSSSKGQALILYLLRRCYAIIYKLLESSEPVSESLQKIHNQLSTVRRCLFELKRMGGVDSERDLYPYQMKLASLDNMRVDGKFYDADGNIPEGQGTLNALLAECFDILHEMKIEAEVREESLPQGNQDDVGEYNSSPCIEMTKDPTNRDVAAEASSISRYVPVQAGDDADDDDLSAHYSEHSYEEEETRNTYD